MKKFRTVQILLVFAGIIGIGVGGAQLFIPVAFESSASINLGNNISLLSEIRAAGGTLLIAGIIIMAGAFIPQITYSSVALSALFYLSYGVSRMLSMSIDGMPSESLVMATVAEIIVGVFSLWVFAGLQKEKIY